MKERLIDTLIYLVGNELNYEEEYNNCENKDYIEDLVNAKLWLMKEKKLPSIVVQSLYEEDKKKYLDK